VESEDTNQRKPMPHEKIEFEMDAAPKRKRRFFI